MIQKPKKILSLPIVTINSKEPNSFSEVTLSLEWRQAMVEEFQALMKQQTWELVSHSLDQHLIDCKWFLRINKDSNGKIARYKARLVAKGYNQ